MRSRRASRAGIRFMLCAMKPQNYFRFCTPFRVRFVLALERNGLACAHKEPACPDRVACVR
jgi:hypothetical protein